MTDQHLLDLAVRGVLWRNRTEMLILRQNSHFFPSYRVVDEIKKHYGNAITAKNELAMG